MKSSSSIFLAAAVLFGTEAGSLLWGQDRAGGPYSMRAEGLSAGGGVASVGTLTVVQVVTPQPVNVTARTGTGLGAEVNSGWVPQLVKPTQFRLNGLFGAGGATRSLDEGTQAAAMHSLDFDDRSYSVPPPGDVQWSVVSGPMAFSAQLPGRVQAQAVYEATPATLGASYRGLSDTLEVTVLNTRDDNYGLLAGDGMDDVWQVTHFGNDAALAQAAADPDHDGLANLDEFLIGTVPTNAASRLEVRFVELGGVKSLFFSPWRADRAYGLRLSEDLGVWSAPVSGLSVLTVTLNGDLVGGLVSDIDALLTPRRRFFRLEATVPGFRP